MKNTPSRKLSRLTGLLTICALPLVAAAVAHADGKQDFTLHNDSGFEIEKVFCSPHDTTDWEEDIMGKDTLPNGEAVDISFDAKEDHDMWDLKITDKDGNSHEWMDIPLEKITDLTIEVKDGADTFEDKEK